MDRLTILLKPGSESLQPPFLYIEGDHPKSFHSKNPEDFSTKLRLFLDDINRLKYLDHIYFVNSPDLSAEENQKLDAYKKAASKTIAVMKSSFGSFEDSLLGVQNLFKNIDIALEKPDIKHLSISKPFDAVVVSAGPSLDLEFDMLRKIQNRCLIISVDAAFKTLMRNGIVPHLVAAVERDDYSIPFFENLPEKISTTLVAHALVDRRIFKAYPGSIATALKYTGPSMWLPFDRTKFWTGSSSAHLAYRTVASLGAKRIALVGQDLCFHPDTFQSHATVEDYPEWSKPSTLEARRNESSIIEAKGNIRERVYTKPSWFMFADDFHIILKETATPTVNTSKLGMKLHGLSFQSLDEWSQSLNQTEIKLSVPDKNPFLEEDKKRLLLKQTAAIEALRQLKNEIQECSDHQKLYQDIIRRPQFLELGLELVFRDWVEVQNTETGHKAFLTRCEDAIDGVLEALSFKI